MSTEIDRPLSPLSLLKRGTNVAELNRALRTLIEEQRTRFYDDSFREFERTAIDFLTARRKAYYEREIADQREQVDDGLRRLKHCQYEVNDLKQELLFDQIVLLHAAATPLFVYSILADI